MTPDTSPHSPHSPHSPEGGLPPAPWVLVDDDTIDQTAMLLERLTQWLQTDDSPEARVCANTLSAGETDEPQSIAHWTDALAARLRRCAEGHEL